MSSIFRKKTRARTRSLFKKWGIVVCALVATGAVGLTTMTASKAATTTVSKEAESGAKSASIQTITDAQASLGSAIRFASNGAERGVFSTSQAAGDPRYVYKLFGGNDDPSRVSEASRSRYQVYLLSPYMTQIAQAIRDSNSSALLYMYKDASSARSNSPTAYGSWCNDNGGSIGHDWGIDYCDAYVNHSDWFMTKGGQKFEYSGYQYHWHMNVAAPGYKERWVANVLADLSATIVWDGVFIDNMLADIKAYVPGGLYPDQYPSIASGQAAYKTYIDYVGQNIRAAGYGVIGNNNGVRLYPGVWSDYTANASGGYDEFWTTFGGTVSSPNNLPLYSGLGWEAQVAELEGFTNSGKLGIATAQDSGGACPECVRYGLGSYLLSNGGKQAYQSGNVDGEPGDYVSRDPLFAFKLGDATSTRMEIQGAGSSLFQRTFSRGLVLVNAHNTNSYSVSLPGTYLDENGSTITSVSVGATRARILRSP